MSRNPSDDESAHESAEEGSEINDGSSESGSESGAESESEASETQGFLDDMAEEGDETEHSDDEDDDDGDLTPSYPFPQFSRLPIELRHKIWELFCPELTSRALTFDFNLTQFQGTTSRTWHLTDGVALYDQTEAIRTVLAVHQESRALALKRFPDPIAIMAEDADAIIRFHPEKDVPILNGLSHLQEIESADQCRLPECFSTLKHFAIGGWELRDRFYPGVIPILIHKFRDLQSLFLCTTSISVQRKKIVWCTSELVHQHDVETFERSPGYGEDLQFLYCWPDLENHADFAKFQIPRGFADSVLAADERILKEKGIGVWPMIAFENRKGLRRYESLYSYRSNGFEDGSESESSEDSGAEEESESGTDLDQYESDGIDDGEIQHFDPDEDDEISIDGDAEDGESGARFSSPESEPETINRTRKRRVVEDSDDEEEEDDEATIDDDGEGRGSEAQFSSPEPEPVNRTRKRRIVEDSDEEEEDEQPAPKRSRMSRAVASDSEDEVPTQSDKRGRASRTIVLDSDSDNDEEAEKPATKQSKRPVVISDSEEDEDSDESKSEESEESESEDEDKSPPRMSLAERLRMHRRDNPVDDESGPEGSGDDDDEEEDEEDDSDDDRRGGASMFFDGMAEEEDEEDDYDESLL